VDLLHVPFYDIFYWIFCLFKNCLNYSTYFRGK
jgi:hypothetical protein